MEFTRLRNRIRTYSDKSQKKHAKGGNTNPREDEVTREGFPKAKAFKQTMKDEN